MAHHAAGRRMGARTLVLALLAASAWLYLILSLLYPDAFGTWNNPDTVLMSMSAEAMVLIAMMGLLTDADRDQRPGLAHKRTF